VKTLDDSRTGATAQALRFRDDALHSSQNPKQSVFLTDVHWRGNPVLWASLDLLDKYGLLHFQIANKAGEADIVLYLESGYLGLSDLPRLLECVQAAPGAMHFMFSESDWPFRVLLGAYTSLSRPHPWAHGWSFLLNADAEVHKEMRSSHAEPELLFSFLGRVATHPIRKRVEMLNKPNTPCLDVEDGPRRFPSFRYSNTYLDLIRQSKFVLCPRGFGASSMRTFEVMSLGRAPVVISDDWQLPPGIPWGEFCVLIREDDVANIPATLERLEGNAISMGQRARQIFEEHFAPNVFLDSLLTTLRSSYANCSFAADAVLRRAWLALGWREFRTLCHQARSFALTSLSNQ
jgi:Exostosin family